MASQLTLSISTKNKEASNIVDKWRKSGMNVSDILCEYVIRYDKELQQQAGTTTAPAAGALIS